jgi:hypothetical protein
MQIATHSNGLGIYVNEMQRSINGLGHYHYPHAQAGGYYDTNIVPYSYWRPYSPHDARGDNCDMLGQAAPTPDLEARVQKLERAGKVGMFYNIVTTLTIVTLGISVMQLRRRARRGGGR